MIYLLSASYLELRLYLLSDSLNLDVVFFQAVV